MFRFPHARRAPESPWFAEMLDPRQLRLAWRQVRANHGAAGHDGVPLDRFGRELHRNLALLADEAREGSYRPLPLRPLLLRDGGKERLLAIPAVRDRVLQRAALDVLNRHLDARFAPCSHGYRPGRGVPDAIRAVRRLADAGNGWAVDADIRDCFGQLDHGLARAALRQWVPDPRLRELIELWLAAAAPGGRGLPLGSVVSPFLCNLSLHALDLALLKRWSPVRYADDFIVLCPTERAAERALADAEQAVRSLKLELNPAKTRIAPLDAGVVFLGVEFRDGGCRPVKPSGTGLLPPEWGSAR